MRMSFIDRVRVGWMLFKVEFHILVRKISLGLGIINEIHDIFENLLDLMLKFVEYFLSLLNQSRYLLFER